MSNSSHELGFGLHKATQNGDEELVQQFLSQGADVDFPAREPWTPLHEATERAVIPVMKILIDHGADVHKKTASGRNPLIIALEQSNTEAVRLLIESGALLEKRSEHGRKALAKAFQVGDNAMIDLLRAAGARTTASDSFDTGVLPSETCGRCAFMADFLSMLDKLLTGSSLLPELRGEKTALCRQCRPTKNPSDIPDGLGSIVTKPQASKIDDFRIRFLIQRRSLLNGAYKDTRSAVQIAAFWLRECLTQHPACISPSLELPILPTRVIDVSCPDKLAKQRLHITNGERGLYITLSYLWGGKSFLKTTKATLKRHTYSIDSSVLPTTMQDAIAICQMIGVKYLWVDALCIVQDCEEDWYSESQTMASIYRNSLFTIAVDGKDPSAGCFERGRSGKPRSNLTNPKKLDGRPGPGPWLGLKPYGPLDTRAWVMQEQLLSRRILSFSNGQLYWDCLTISASQASLAGCSVEKSDSGLLRVYFGNTANNIRDQRALLAWRNLVQQYSNRQITMVKDKIVATLGCAKVMAEILDDEYVAGLWKRRLWKDLLWWVSTPGSRNHHLRLLSAPSWSWGSVRDPISYELPYGVSDSGLQSCIDIITIRTTWKGKEGKMNGAVTLLGSIFPTATIPDFPMAGTDWLPASYSNWPPLPTWRPDTQMWPHAQDSLRLQFLPIAISQYYVMGLGVAPLDGSVASPTYHRIGLFYWHRSHDRYLYNNLVGDDTQRRKRVKITLV